MSVVINTRKSSLTSQQEVGDNLSVCVMSFFPKVNSLPSLLTINLRYRFFK